MRGPRCPPRPVPCPQPPAPQRPRTPSPPSPRPMPQADSRRRDIWVPVGDGSYITANGDVCVVRSNFTGSVTVSTDGQGRRVVREVGKRIIKEEVKKEPLGEESALPPFTSLMRGPRTSTPPPRPPLPVSADGASAASFRNPPPRPPPPRWVSPQSQRSESPPPPYQGLVITEAPRSPPSPYGEVKVEQLPLGVRGNCFISFI